MVFLHEETTVLKIKFISWTLAKLPLYA